MQRPLLLTVPHSGELIPQGCSWLTTLSEPHLMCDVDRFVDRLYLPFVHKNSVPHVISKWHRYAADLNRFPEDIDADSVLGAKAASGTHPRGFHWVRTTTNLAIMNQPMSMELHKKLVEEVHDPFHQQINERVQELRAKGAQEVFHLDLHSMPSVGTSEHRDPGERRADVVISDSLGKSASREFVDLVILSFVRSGLKASYNWPYFGGRITERYGNPKGGHHCVQVEVSRDLYMDEVSKSYQPEKAEKLQKKLEQALTSLLAIKV